MCNIMDILIDILRGKGTDANEYALFNIFYIKCMNMT